MLALLWVYALLGFAVTINIAGAPFIARSFELGEGGIARLYAWISVSALGVLVLSRLADRYGRRPVLVASVSAMSLLGLATAAATDLVVFAVLDTAFLMAAGTAFSCAVILLAESLAKDRRAWGQGIGGLASALGSGTCLVSVAILESAGISWRWLFVGAACGALVGPLLGRMLPESGDWKRPLHPSSEPPAEDPSAATSPGREHLQVVALVIVVFLGTAAGAAVDGWSYFHGVVNAKLSPGAMSALVVIAGGVGLAGFPLGAWGCDRFGRVPTVAFAWVVCAAGAFAFYRSTPDWVGSPFLWLGFTFAWFNFAQNAAVVGIRAISTEVVSANSRGGVMGWLAIAGAGAGVTAQVAVAVLATRAGGLANVVAYMALLTVPAGIVLALFVRETRSPR